MTNEAIRGALRRFIETELAAGAAFADDESLMESGVLSSMGIARLIQFINEQFQVAIDDLELEPENFETLDALTVLVTSKHAA